MLLVLAVALAATLSSISQAQQAAGPIQIGSSFNCLRLGTEPSIPALVCQTPELRQADLQQMQTYYTLRHALPERQQELRNQFVARIQALVRECSIDDVRLGGSQSACVARALADLRTFWLQQIQQTANPWALEETRQTVAALEEAQRALRQRGFLPADAVLDGVYGSGTRQAIFRFQTESGIPTNGFLTSATASALREVGVASISGLTANATQFQTNNIQPLDRYDIDALLRTPQHQINNQPAKRNTAADSLIFFINSYLTVPSLLLAIIIFTISTIIMLSLRMKKCLLIKFAVIGGFFIFPLLSERAKNSCHALEITTFNFFRKAISDVQSFEASVVSAFLVVATGLSDGIEASEHLMRRHPDLSPSITCSLYYWVIFFSPNDIDLMGGLFDKNPGDLAQRIIEIRKTAREDSEITKAGQAVNSVDGRGDSFHAARRHLGAGHQADSSPAEQQQTNGASVEMILARLRGQAQQQHDNGSNAAVGTSLTQAEVRSLSEQIAECWHVDGGMMGLQHIVVEMRVRLDGQGNVRNVVPAGNMPGDPRVRAVFESARRALLSPQCNPLRLPPEKYETVMQSIFRFSPRGLVQ
jgi:hypothetical protein